MTENENNNQTNNIETTQATATETNKQQNNKKTLIIIASAIIALVVIIVIIIVVLKPGSLFSNSTSSDDNRHSMTEEEKQEYMDQLNSTEGMDLSQILYTYAIEIYNEKKYENLPKDERGIYYASKYDLMLMEYDTSMIPEECSDERPIIYFDIENKLNDSYEFEPIVYDIFCENK